MPTIDANTTQITSEKTSQTLASEFEKKMLHLTPLGISHSDVNGTSIMSPPTNK